MCVVRDRGCRFGETDTERVHARRDKTQRGCRRGETDICVLSGREGAGLERHTERVQARRDRH